MWRVYEDTKHCDPLKRGAHHFYHTDDIARLFGYLNAACSNRGQSDGEFRHRPINEGFVKSCMQRRTHDELSEFALFLWFSVADGIGRHRIFLIVYWIYEYTAYTPQAENIRQRRAGGTWVNEGETLMGWKVESVSSTKLQQQDRTIELELYVRR